MSLTHKKWTKWIFRFENKIIYKDKNYIIYFLVEYMIRMRIVDVLRLIK